MSANTVTAAATKIAVETGSDNYLRWQTPAQFISNHSISTSGHTHPSYVNQNAFSNVAVSGQSTVAADNATDTLTLVAGTNITMTTNATSDSVTINASSGAPAANSVGQNELKDTNAVLSTTSTTLVWLTSTAGTHAFSFQLYHTSTGTSGTGSLSGYIHYENSTTPRKRFALKTTTQTAYLREYYVQASPPYDLGDGYIPLFVFMLVEKGTGKVVAASLAPEAPWHYNGHTNIRATRKDGARSWKEVPQIIKDLDDANLTKQEAVRLGVYTRAEIQDRILRCYD